MAPIVATLIGSGFNLLAGAVKAKGKELIEEKLGVNLDEALASEEGRLKLRQAELDHEEFLVEASLKREEMAYKDTADARAMNTRINESANATWLAKNIVPILALVVVIGGMGILVTTQEADVRTATVGLMTLVLGFFFGSSRNSQAKDDTIRALSRGDK